ncbi:hypothetical protein NC651_014932 [Populus alba x Populus x berolinensis]|nr:hypothetical protein NC651_014932 [Populus alba x Populus x berolinensis]
MSIHILVGEDVYIFADYSDDKITPLRAVAACNLAEVNSDFLLDGEVNRGFAAPSHQDLSWSVIEESGRGRSVIFENSVDASNLIHSTDGLYELLKLMVEEVGAGNILQSRDLSTITVAVLNLMRQFTSGCDIVQQGITRSATNFTTLERMANFKLNLANHGNLTGVDGLPFYKATLGGLAMRAKETIKKELVKREDYMVYLECFSSIGGNNNGKLLLHAAEGDLGKKLDNQELEELCFLLIGGLYMADLAQIWHVSLFVFSAKPAGQLGVDIIIFPLRRKQNSQIPEDPISFDDVSRVEE